MRSVDRLVPSYRGRLVRLFPRRRDQSAHFTLFGRVRTDRPSIRRARVRTDSPIRPPSFGAPLTSSHPTPSVISVTTHSAVLSSTDAPLNKLSSGGLFGSRRGGGSHQSSWLGFFVKLLLFVGLCVGGAYAYKAYQLRSRHGAFSSSSAGTFGGGLGADFGNRRSYASRRRF